MTKDGLVGKDRGGG